MNDQDGNTNNPFIQSQYAAQSPPVAQQHVTAITPQTSIAAIISLIVGILALFLCVIAFCFFPLGIIVIPLALGGLISGIMGLRNIKRSDQQLGGRGMALAGTITSSIALVLMLIVIAGFLLFFGVMGKIKRDMPSNNSGKALYLAVEEYLADNNEAFPNPNDWRTVIGAKTLQTEGQLNYWAMNDALEGLMFEDVQNPSRTVLLFQVDSNSPASGDEFLLISGSGTRGRYYVVFVSGRVSRVTLNTFDDLIWDPEAAP